MVNQGNKVAPGVIKAITNNINAIATDMINQIISQGGKEMERALPKILTCWCWYRGRVPNSVEITGKFWKTIKQN